jgi:hypothetical protein
MRNACVASVSIAIGGLQYGSLKKRLRSRSSHAMGTSAALFFTIASVNKTQIATVAQVLGKTTEQLGVPDKCMTTPVTVTLHGDGTATLSESALPSVVSIGSEESA